MDNTSSFQNEIIKLKNIIKATRIGTWEWEVQTGKVTFNDIWAETIGYTLEELSPLSIETLMNNCHEEDLKKSNDLLNRVFSKELECYETELRMKHKDGSWIWVLDKGEVVKWSEQGLPLLMVGSHTNITKIKELSLQLEKSLEDVTKSEKVFKSLYENAPVGYQSLDDDGNFLLVNKAYADMLGYEIKDMIGKHFGEFMTEESLTRLPKQFSSFVSTGKVDVIFKMIHKDKHTIDVRFLGRVALDLDGNFKQTHCIIFDYTDILKYQSILKENEDKLKLILNSTAEGIYGVGENEECTFVNYAFLNMLGYTDENEVLNKNMHNLIHHSYEDGSHFPVEKCDMMSAFRKGVLFKQEDIIWKKDGTLIQVEYSSNPQIKDGKIIGAVFTFVDITERKLSEQKIAHSRKLLRFIIENNKSAVAVHDRDFKYLYVSQSYIDQYNIKDENIIGKHHYEVFPDLPQKWRDVHQKALLGEISSSDKDLYVKADGTKEWTRWECRPWYESDNSIGGFIVYTEVITKQVNMIENLRISEYNLNLSQSIANVGSWILDLETNLVWGSEEAFKIYELDRKSKFIDRSLLDNMVDNIDANISDKALEDLILHNKPYDITFKLITDKGNVKHINRKATLQYDENHNPIRVIGVIHDITNVKEKELELEYAANYDYLTGLHNRRYYEEKIADYNVEENFPLTVVMADINGLKLINDAFGHESGDELLISAANLIKECCNKNDLVARIGGDEFVIIMPKTNGKQAEKVISKIHSKSTEVSVQSIQLSISFGYKTKTLKSEDFQDVYRSAEDLMYREKLLEIPSMRSSAIETILSTLFEKDENSEVHSRRVSELSEKIAIFYGMNRQDVSEVKTAGLLHDIGKIIIPSTILNKEGELTKEEFTEMKTHPEIGFRVLNSTHDMRSISDIVLNHHERWDGKGYPLGAKGENIPLKSRIITIADAFHAMTSLRSYRDIISNEEALEEIMRCSGKQFDPNLAKVFKQHFLEIIEI